MSTRAPYIQSGLWLPTDNGALYAFAVASSFAPLFRALILPPFLESRKSTARMLVDVARALADAGGSVLIVDPRGCGESPGSLDDVTPRDWVADIRAADAWQRQALPDLPGVWLGLRFSAAVCLSAACDALDQDLGTERTAPAQDRPNQTSPFLVLWAPIPGGEQALRLWTQRRRVNQMLNGVPQETFSTIIERLEEGKTVDFDGFPFSPAFASDLRAFYIPGTDEAQPPARSCQALALLPAPDRRTEKTLRACIPEIEINVERIAPFWNAVGLVDGSSYIVSTVSWVRSVIKTGRSTRQDEARTSPSFVAESSGRLSSIRAEQPSCCRPCETPASSKAMPLHVEIGSESNRIRGFFHLPASGLASRGRVLMLHGWSGCRLGPQRLFVRAARRLSALGYSCLRMDFRGRGESDGDAAAASMSSLTHDAAEALAWLRNASSGPLLLIGMCSGCKVALHAAAHDPGIKALALWSAEPMGRLRATDANRRKTRFALRVYARKLFNPLTWRKLILGRVRLDMVRKAVSRHETRGTDEARLENEVLDRLPDSSASMLFVYGEGDPEARPGAFAYQTFCARHNLDARTIFIPGANHNFSSTDWEARLVDASLDFFSLASRSDAE